MSDELVYYQMPHFPKEVEVAINASMMVEMQGNVPRCCYQLSEGVAYILRELDFDPDARAIACDVYAWNYDMVAHAGGMPIKAPRVKAKKNHRHPQRKSRGKIPTRPDLKPYYLGIFHEQEVVDGGGYDGHVIVEAKGHMIDCTAGQFHRPQHKVKSKEFIVFPSASCQPLPKSYRDMIQRPRGDHPDAGRDLFADGSLEQELITISSPKVLKKEGQMAYCIRPDIDRDRWMNHGPNTQENIKSSNELLLSVAQQLMEHDPSKGLGGTIQI
jgi:hypothetical protein